MSSLNHHQLFKATTKNRSTEIQQTTLIIGIKYLTTTMSLFEQARMGGVLGACGTIFVNSENFTYLTKSTTIRIHQKNNNRYL